MIEFLSKQKTINSILISVLIFGGIYVYNMNQKVTLIYDWVSSKKDSTKVDSKKEHHLQVVFPVLIDTIHK